MASLHSVCVNPITRASRVRSSNFGGAAGHRKTGASRGRPKNWLRAAIYVSPAARSTQMPAINPTDAVASGNRRSRRGADSRRRRSAPTCIQAPSARTAGSSSTANRIASAAGGKAAIAQRIVPSLNESAHQARSDFPVRDGACGHASPQILHVHDRLLLF